VAEAAEQLLHLCLKALLGEIVEQTNGELRAAAPELEHGVVEGGAPGRGHGRRRRPLLR